MFTAKLMSLSSSTVSKPRVVATSMDREYNNGVNDSSDREEDTICKSMPSNKFNEQDDNTENPCKQRCPNCQNGILPQIKTKLIKASIKATNKLGEGIEYVFTADINNHLCTPGHLLL